MTTEPAEKVPASVVEAELIPLPTGRMLDGRFAPGNRIAKGNPFGQRVNEIRQALFDAVTNEDVRDIVQKLIERAKRGDVWCAREVLDRCLGRSTQHVEATGADTIVFVAGISVEDVVGPRK